MSIRHFAAGGKPAGTPPVRAGRKPARTAEPAAVASEGPPPAPVVTPGPLAELFTLARGVATAVAPGVTASVTLTGDTLLIAPPHRDLFRLTVPPGPAEPGDAADLAERLTAEARRVFAEYPEGATLALVVRETPVGGRGSWVGHVLPAAIVPTPVDVPAVRAELRRRRKGGAR